MSNCRSDMPGVTILVSLKNMPYYTLIGYVLSNIAGVLLFLFIFWKKLKEDYSSTIIFSTGFTSLIGGVLGVLLALLFKPSFWFWVAFLFLILGIFLCIYKFSLRPYEIIEGFVIAVLPWVSLFLFLDSVVNKNIYSLLFSIGVVAQIVLYFWFDSNYKKFVWYRSGRVGFSGLATLGFFFLLRAGIALIKPDMVSFVGSYEVFVSAFFGFSVFLLLFNLSRG